MTNLSNNFQNTQTNIFLFVKAAKHCTIGESALQRAANKLQIRPESLKMLIQIQRRLQHD